MTTAEILKAAREKIATPEKWTKGTYTAVHNGIECHCARGAILDAAPPAASPLAAYRVLRRAIGPLENEDWGIEGWNDAPERTHAEVLAAFDRAIEMAEGRS